MVRSRAKRRKSASGPTGFAVDELAVIGDPSAGRPCSRPDVVKLKVTDVRARCQPRFRLLGGPRWTVGSRIMAPGVACGEAEACGGRSGAKREQNLPNPSGIVVKCYSLGWHL